jgi:hypothetical protein
MKLSFACDLRHACHENAGTLADNDELSPDFGP